jgi:hypothetical protein
VRPIQAAPSQIPGVFLIFVVAMFYAEAFARFKQSFL